MIYIVCGVYTEENKNGFNIITRMDSFKATSKDEAIGKYIGTTPAEYSNYLVKRPLCFSITDAEKIAEGNGK